MKVFIKRSLQNKVDFLWEILVVFVLSILILVPAPALALDYNGTLQSYISSVKVDIEDVVTSLRSLKNLSYTDSQEILGAIDSKLQKIQSSASKNAVDFQKFSTKSQERYDDILMLENLKYQVREKRREIRNVVEEKKYWYMIDLDSDHIYRDYHKYMPEPVPTLSYQMFDLEKKINNIRGKISNQFPEDYKTLLEVEKLQGDLFYNMGFIVSEFSEEVRNQIDLYSDNIFQRGYGSIGDKVRDIRNQIKYLNRRLKGSSLDKQELTNGIVLANKISKLCDDLEKRVELAKQKFGNVKEYALALNSLSDPDVLGEVNELDKFIVDLTKNLPNAS